MIKSIVGQGHIVVNGAYGNTPYFSSTAPSAGMVRYLENNLQVYDGSGWQTLGGAIPSIELSGSAAAALDWAIKKMQEEHRLDELCKKYPGLERARENFESFKRLVDAEEAVS